ncbi:MAG: hypothetical protein AB7I27_13165 [Bacteriovoracaceae bacterium]
MLKQNPLIQNFKYYTTYQFIYVVIVVLLSSIGAFFHFLLNHEISIVESWLHNNQWEILIVSKVTSAFLLGRWFQIRSYNMKPIRLMIKELVEWPEPQAIVISLFMLVSLLTLGEVGGGGQNLGHWYNQFTSFIGLFLFFGIDFVVLTYLGEFLTQRDASSRMWTGIGHTFIFSMAYKVSVPDYYGLLGYVIFCYSTLFYLSGKLFKSWSNIVCFLLLFVAPMGTFFGMDPVWGDDFSSLRMMNKLNLAFLAAIWMISFGYYNYRNQFLKSFQKYFR